LKNPDSKIRFKTKQKLVKHLHKHHPDKMTLRKLTEEQELAKSFPEAFYDDENKKWSCTLCGFSSRAYYMKRHVEYKHRKAVVATCGVCGKGFTHMQTFREHEYTHTGDYPAVCQYCGKGFKNEYRLREIHKKKHHPQEYEVEKRLLEEEKKKEANMKVLKQGGISISELNL
jgi:KRAB domain-containing zinc finger protein